MSEMVDRVMAAIRPLIEDECNCDPGEHAGRVIARAAIAAMREPTESMMLAADVSPYLGECWRAMIDAELSEEVKA